MLGDGLIIRESRDSFITSSDPMLQWFRSRVGGDRVEILDLTDRYGKGPRSAVPQPEAVEIGLSGCGRSCPQVSLW
ncbi:hypothetical protein, partial [Rhodobacter sp. SGA-6-6]|uniref:hypothetical protein n=1 Tax=Rhodobacter sp. SGA-6-6 TaxID=2710882 RepID=UPI001980B176